MFAVPLACFLSTKKTLLAISSYRWTIRLGSKPQVRSVRPKSKTYNSQYSLVVTHPTTNWPLTRFSWPIRREAELSGCYGRMYYDSKLFGYIPKNQFHEKRNFQTHDKDLKFPQIQMHVPGIVSVNDDPNDPSQIASSAGTMSAS